MMGGLSPETLKAIAMAGEEVAVRTAAPCCHGPLPGTPWNRSLGPR
jgi:hypothetical protein